MSLLMPNTKGDAVSMRPNPSALTAIIGTKTISLPIAAFCAKPMPDLAPLVIANRLLGPQARFSAKQAGRKMIQSINLENGPRSIHALDGLDINVPRLPSLARR